MFTDGLVAEVEALCEAGPRGVARRGRSATPALDYLDGTIDLDQARELTFIGTRRYVRRQRSWFRRDHRITWLDGGDPDLLTTAMGLSDPIERHRRRRRR